MKFLVGVLVVIIIGLVGGLAYFAGKSANTNTGGITSTLPTPTAAAPTATATAETLLPTKPVTKKVNGGGILSFPKYELTIPADWEASKEIPGPDSEKVILKKSGYEVSILEGGFGGSICLYPGDADMEGPSARYEQFMEITTRSGDILRRSWTGSGGFAICHKTQYGWNAPTLFGHISIKTPAVYTPQMITEIDNILASLTRI